MFDPDTPNPQVPEDVAEIADWNRMLDGKVAVVTGGGDGIGGAISRLFAEHGATVEIAEIDPERAERKLAEIADAGNTARAHVLDVTKYEDVARLREEVLGTHGRIDVLINNVGDFRPLVRFDDSTPESWNWQYQINLEHMFSTCRAFIGPMVEQGNGSIVNFHSVEGMRGYPGDPVYGAMKAAAVHFTTCLAVTYGRYGVRGQRHRPRPHPDPAGRLHDPRRRVRAPVAGVGASRPPGLAGGSGPRRAVPGLRHGGVRDRPQHPDRRRHEGRWRLVLLAQRALASPTARPGCEPRHGPRDDAADDAAADARADASRGSEASTKARGPASPSPNG